LSGVDDGSALDALRAVERGDADEAAAMSMRLLAERLDRAAWTAQEAADEARYDSLFRRSRAVAALAYALAQEPHEAIYDAAYALAS
jgi:hypothetical protein